MFEFIKGFVCGFVLKKYSNYIISNVLYFIVKRKIQTDKIKKISFVCKLKDHHDSIEIQPYWKYFINKKTIKINLDDDLINYFNTNKVNFDINDMFELRDNNNEHLITLFLPYFKKFGTVYVYITYVYKNKTYINLYSEHDIINSNDFKINKINNDYCICSCIKYNENIEYITDYFNMFSNNVNILTPELLLLNYNNLDIDPELCHLNNITDKGFKKYYFDELI